MTIAANPTGASDVRPGRLDEATLKGNFADLHPLLTTHEARVEAEFRDLLMRARLPKPMFNARILDGNIFIAEAGTWWSEAGVAAEVDSREWHLKPEDWERTLRRHAAMTARGILVLHFTPRMIRDDPAKVIAEIRDAIRAGSARPTLKLRALPAA